MYLFWPQWNETNENENITQQNLCDTAANELLWEKIYSINQQSRSHMHMRSKDQSSSLILDFSLTMLDVQILKTVTQKNCHQSSKTEMGKLQFSVQIQPVDILVHKNTHSYTFYLWFLLEKMVLETLLWLCSLSICCDSLRI